MEGSLSDTGLNVAAMRDDECWDLLLSLDVMPVQIGAEWACSICEAEGRHTRFSSREELWRDHLFDPLAKWVNEELAQASRIDFQRLGCGSTWARLAHAPTPREGVDLAATIAHCR